MVRRLTQQINGTIIVDSVKDKGSCFTLSLPLGEAQATQQTDARTSNSTLSGLKALCVDDKIENLDALSLLLKKWGIEAELANTYEAGLAKIGEFDAYHLDMTSPYRAKLASSLEMRPQDVVYIGAQPLVNYNRALGLLLGTAQTTLQGSQTVVRAAQGNQSD